MTPLAEADLAPDGLSSTTHVLELCPRYDDIFVPGNKFRFGLVEASVEE